MNLTLPRSLHGTMGPLPRYRRTLQNDQHTVCIATACSSSKYRPKTRSKLASSWKSLHVVRGIQQWPPRANRTPDSGDLLKLQDPRLPFVVAFLGCLGCSVYQRKK